MRQDTAKHSAQLCETLVLARIGPFGYCARSLLTILAGGVSAISELAALAFTELVDGLEGNLLAFASFYS